MKTVNEYTTKWQVWQLIKGGPMVRLHLQYFRVDCNAVEGKTKQLAYSKNPLIRNPVLEISLFCFLYKGTISRISLNHYIRNFFKNIFCSCFLRYSVILYSISPVSRHNRQYLTTFRRTVSASVPSCH